MKKEKLLQDIKMTTNTLNLNPDSHASLFKRAVSYIELDKLNNNNEHSEEILKDLTSAINLNSENPQYLSTLMDFYCTIGKADEAIKTGVSLEKLLQNTPKEGVVEMSSKQTLSRVLEMKEVLEATQDNPELHAAFKNLMNFLSPHITKIEEHTTQLLEHEHKIEEATTILSEHTSRISHDEEEMQQQKTAALKVEEKLLMFIEKYEQEISSLVKKEDITKLSQEFAEQKNLMTKTFDSEPLDLQVKISEVKKKVKDISQELIDYVDGYYSVLSNSITASNLNDSNILSLSYHAGKIQEGVNKSANVINTAANFIPVAGSIVTAGTSAISAGVDTYFEHKSEGRMNNFAAIISKMDPNLRNNMIYNAILQNIYKNQSKVLKRIEVNKKIGAKFYKVYSKQSPEHNQYKLAGEKAYESNIEKVSTTTGAQDSHVLLENLFKHAHKKDMLLDKIYDLFESMPEAAVLDANYQLMVQEHDSSSKSRVTKIKNNATEIGIQKSPGFFNKFKSFGSKSTEKSKALSHDMDHHEQSTGVHNVFATEHERMPHDSTTHLSGHTSEFNADV